MTAARTHLFTATIPIRSRDIDPYQHVNHSVYFVYMEEARWQWFFSLKEKSELLMLVVDAQLAFKKPLTYPGSALVKVYAEQLEKKSWVMYHEVCSEAEPEVICAEGGVKFVAFDPKAKAVIALPEHFRGYLS